MTPGGEFHVVMYCKGTGPDPYAPTALGPVTHYIRGVNDLQDGYTRRELWAVWRSLVTEHDSLAQPLQRNGNDKPTKKCLVEWIERLVRSGS